MKRAKVLHDAWMKDSKYRAASNSMREEFDLAGAMIAAVGYTSSALTRHYLEVHQISTQADQWKLTAEHKQIELQQLREETQNALIAQARSEGELRAQNPHAVPKTTLTERVANLFISPEH